MHTRLRCYIIIGIAAVSVDVDERVCAAASILQDRLHQANFTTVVLNTLSVHSVSGRMHEDARGVHFRYDRTL